MEKKLYRDEQHKVIGGVCAGLADYFGVDVTIIRVAFAFALVLKGVGFLPYIILWIVLPKKNPFLYGPGPTVDYTVPPQEPFNPFTNTNTPPPFGSGPFGKGAPFAVPPLPKRNSNFAVIAGAVLIVMGGAFLFNEFDLIPDIDFDIFWPIVLVLAGIGFIFSGARKQPWDRKDWSQTPPPAEPKEPQDFDINNQNNTNPPTV
ncbi:PspC domain-containing protein [Mucilaginibacter gynuensis]|uniref:PspC domain-containing protein n=1 Tax=Mucilaginibacter gynuensis TaxID=1302236 RepID=A0ABP8GRF6_9SPHI